MTFPVRYMDASDRSIAFTNRAARTANRPVAAHRSLGRSFHDIHVRELNRSGDPTVKHTPVAIQIHCRPSISERQRILNGLVEI